jgi:hypothetical protein
MNPNAAHPRTISFTSFAHDSAKLKWVAATRVTKMLKKAIVCFATGALLSTSSTATAQFSGGGPTPSEGACFYRDANYRGQYFCVAAGDDVSTMPSGANDRVSSIRIFGRAEVTVFEGARFRGESLRFDSNVRDLESEDFNDAISSIQVEGRSSGGGRGRGNRRSSGSQASPEVIIRRAYQDILERDPDPAGMRTYRSHIIDDGWTEQDIRDALRKSPEYREKTTMTRAKAEEIVRQAYLSILKREPDPASQRYVNNVLRDKWTQQDVERELRKSPEYRGRKPSDF